MIFISSDRRVWDSSFENKISQRPAKVLINNNCKYLV